MEISIDSDKYVKNGDNLNPSKNKDALNPMLIPAISDACSQQGKKNVNNLKMRQGEVFQPRFL